MVYFFAEEAIRQMPEHELLVTKYPSLAYIDNYQNFRLQTMHREKQCVIFACKRGVWLKPFHCYHQNPEYAFYSLDLAEGCHFDCVYCYLQTYLNHGALVLFLEDARLRTELETLSSTVRSSLWISTGLLSDSLLTEQYYPLLSKVASWIPDGSILEARSKADSVSSLAGEEIGRKKLVISWSLNPQIIAERFEYGAVRLDRRLQAARQVMGMGYRVGFHLDPIFYFEGWESAYANLFEAFRDFNEKNIAFFSVGLFRYMPDLGTTIRNRFPYHSILTGEFFPDRDGKYHYFRPIRKEMYRKFDKWLSPWKDSVPILWSMEPDGRLLVK